MSATELRELARAATRTAARVSAPFTEAKRPTRPAAVPTVIPLLGLDVAAGDFDGSREDPRVRWVRPHTSRAVARRVLRSAHGGPLDGAHDPEWRLGDLHAPGRR